MRGCVKKVIFHEPSNGYTVMRVRERSSSKTTTVVGHMPTRWARAGEHIEVVRGEWVLSRDYGSQLRAHEISVIMPHSSQEIERYLSTFVRGVGPARAKKIVAQLGPNALDVLEAEPSRIFEVKGVGRSQLLKIQASIAEHAESREALEFLTTHGLGHGMAMSIWQKYGAATISSVTANPYELTFTIPSFTFEEADVLANRLGVSDEAAIRIRSALHEALKKVLGRHGHCAYLRDKFVAGLIKTLRVSRAAVEGALQHEVDEERMCVREMAMPEGMEKDPRTEAQESDASPPCMAAAPPGKLMVVSPAGIARSESSIASHLVRLKTAQSHAVTGYAAHRRASQELVDQLSTRARAEFEAHTADLSAQQRDAVLQALCSNVSIITGGPGVGKTWTVGSILRIYESLGHECIVCAPTGRAAARLQELTGHEATTIHRALESTPNSNVFARHAGNPLNAALVIVDEASMLDVYLASHLFQAIPTSATLLLVGDVDQLPSVGPGRVLSDLISSEVIPTSRLTRVYRQQDESSIINAAHSINAGLVPAMHKCADVLEVPRHTGDVSLVELKSTKAVTQAIVSLVDTVLPQHLGIAPLSVQVLTPMNGGTLGSRNLNAVLQARLNPPAENKREVERFGFLFREGDKIMQLVNDYEKGVYNGELGTIVRITSGRGKAKARVYCDFDRLKYVVYEMSELEQIAPAYAITIHKSQGSEFPVVVMPAHLEHRYMLQRNLMYTGVTRAKQLAVMVGSEHALEYAVQRTAGIGTQRWTCLQECVREEHERVMRAIFPA